MNDTQQKTMSMDEMKELIEKNLNHDETEPKEDTQQEIAQGLVEKAMGVSIDYFYKQIQNIRLAAYDFIKATEKFNVEMGIGMVSKECQDAFDQQLFRMYLATIVGTITAITPTLVEYLVDDMVTNINEQFGHISNDLANVNRIISVHEGQIQHIINPVSDE